MTVDWDQAHPEPVEDDDEGEGCPNGCDEDGLIWFEVEHSSGKVLDDAVPCPAHR